MPIAATSSHCLPFPAQVPTPHWCFLGGTPRETASLPGSGLASGGAQTKSQVHLPSHVLHTLPASDHLCHTAGSMVTAE